MDHDISNLITYINSMSVTLYDKCWWIDKVPANVNTVVDFGCAGGDLAFMINRIMPGRFTYVGVDNSPTMLDLARHNFSVAEPDFPFMFFNNLPEAIRSINPRKTVFVMNSVIHEIFTYLDADEADELFKLIFNSDFEYIAIRDMHDFGDNWELPSWIEDHIKMIKMTKYAQKWDEFMSRYEAESLCGALNEFLLKYRYDANWDRESREIYLWDWRSFVVNKYGRLLYHIDFENDFYIPYIKNKILEDFGFIYPRNTHKKVLLKNAKF